MAEKKSTKGKATPKKRVAKKVEEPKPVSEVHPAVEQVKPREINWDVIGSSSGITLILTAAIFLIGWAYEANWYGFFGINMNQINTPIQQIFIYGFPVVFRVFVLLSLLILFTFIIKINKKSNAWIFTDANWLLIFGFLNILILYLIYSLVYSAFGQSIFLNDELNIILPAEISGSVTGGSIFMIMSIVMAFFLWVIESESRPNKSIWIKGLSFALGMKEISKSNLQNISKRGWLILMLITFYIEVLGLSASTALGNASIGQKSVGGYVQQVYLVSPRQVNSIKDFELSCDQDNCEYGSFGLVAENNQSFYMIAWNENNIPFHPGLFIFPRNDQNEPYIIIPVLLSTTVPEATQTVASTPTPVIIVAPTPKSP